MAKIGDDLFEGFDEAAEEEIIRPKMSEPAELIIKRILTMKPDMTYEAVVGLIEGERAKSANLLTEEATAHIVASDLGADEIGGFFDTDTAEAIEQEPTPKGEGTESESRIPKDSVKDSSVSPDKEAPAQTEDEDSWFGEPEEEKPSEVTVVKEAPAGDDLFSEPVEGQPSAEEPVEEAVEADEFFEPAGEEEAPTEEPLGGAIVTIRPSSIVSLAITPEDMRAQMKLFQRMKASILDKGPKGDIATIQGEPYIKRSGWRKFALAFNLSDEIIKEEKELMGDDFTWRIHVRAWAPNGRSVVGIGACSSEEREFAHLQHDVYAVAHTRAKNRALSDLIGSGEVSWDELKGFDYQ